MAGRRLSALHLGGPLGLAGLSVLAGAAGLMVIAGNDSEESQRAVRAAGHTSSAVETDVEPTSETRSLAVRPQAVENQPEMTSRQLTPGVQVAPQTKPPAAPLPASAKGAEVTFIVRLKGQPEIDVISRNFKKDPETAHKAFADLCDRLPGLKQFQLVGASYSGEIKLAYQFAPGVSPTRAAIDDIKAKIMAIEGVAYADPDYVAHPGEDKR